MLMASAEFKAKKLAELASGKKDAAPQRETQAEWDARILRESLARNPVQPTQAEVAKAWKGTADTLPSDYN